MPVAHANYLLNKYCIDPLTQKIDVPINPINLVLAEGLTVKPLPSPKWNLSGEVVPEKKLIMFNPTDSITRQRFTIAHELGHYVLHHGSAFSDPVQNSWLNAYDLNEILANRFAAALLMPERVIKALIEGEGITNAESLCSILDVSLDTLEARLRYLGFA